MASSVDLLVLGAGAAGTACAIHAAAAGLQAAIVSAAIPRERPGETLHPGVEPVLDQLGVGDAVRAAGWLRHAGHLVGPDRRFIAYGEDARGPWHGFQAPTAQFDELLRARCRALGVRFICGAAEALLHDSSPNGHRVAGVQVAGHDVRALVTVDATGPARFAKKQLRLDERVTGPKRVTASGWLWLAPIQDSVCAWVWGPRATAKSDRRSVLADLLGAADPGRVRGTVASSSIVEHAGAPAHLLFAGDAAFSLSPLAGRGVLRALLMGIMAADTAARIVACPTGLNGVTGSYQQWLTKWFEHEAAAVQEVHPF
jgi:flavin-dependent dehydrogenase